MKDGSVTLPLGTVDIQPGTRLRFFVRESDFAKKEVQALWMGYKKRELTLAMQDNANNEKLVPSACVLMSTLDRGSKFFGGKGGFESNTVGEYIPNIPCIAGYFSNGVIGRLDDLNDNEIEHVYGSASSYTLLGSSK
jgi:small ligand-binding sensory domain FIST